MQNVICYNDREVKEGQGSKEDVKKGSDRNPDLETLRKLKRDPNKESFKKRHNLTSDNQLFQIELEALQTPQARDEFKRLVLESIDQFFEDDIYREVLLEHPRVKIKGLVYKKIKSLLKRL